MGFAARLDDIGKPAWIALMILGFIFFWPVGLAVLAFLIWSRRMGCWKHRGHGRWHNEGIHEAADRWLGGGRRDATSGNRAFDEYRADTLAPARGGATRVSELPRPPALCQGQGRVRPIPGRAAPARGAATATSTKLGRVSPVCGHYWGVCLKNRLPACRRMPHLAYQGVDAPVRRPLAHSAARPPKI